MTADDEVRESARLHRFLRTGEIQPRYDVRDVLGRGAHTPRPRINSRMGGSECRTHIPVSTIDS